MKQSLPRRREMVMLQMELLPATLIVMLLPTQIATQFSACLNVKTGGASKGPKAPIQLTAFTDIVSTEPFLIGFFASHQAMQENIDVTLFPYDVGTDSGVSYESPDMTTNPPQPISKFTTGYPLTPNLQEAPVRAFTFIRQ